MSDKTKCNRVDAEIAYGTAATFHPRTGKTIYVPVFPGLENAPDVFWCGGCTQENCSGCGAPATKETP